MFLSSSRIILATPECDTLKEKRSVLKSIIVGVKPKFNISISETGFYDNSKKCEISIAFVTNQKDFADKIINQVLSFIEKRHPGRIEEYDLDIYFR
jgi:uncharacterized protein YlxP (DUF503 family)